MSEMIRALRQAKIDYTVKNGRLLAMDGVFYIDVTGWNFTRLLNWIAPH